MFTSLSRGSSRVRKAYICSSCLSNALTHAPPAPLLTADRVRRAVSLYSTTSDAQPTNNDVSDPVQTLDTEPAKHGKSAGAADTVDGKKAEKGRRSKGGGISSSAETLKALRNSLALAAEKENDRNSETLKSTIPQGKAAVARSKRGTRKLGVAQGKNEKKISETEEPTKDNAKTKKTTPKSSLKGNQSGGSASDESNPPVRRKRRKQKVKETKVPEESAPNITKNQDRKNEQAAKDSGKVSPSLSARAGHFPRCCNGYDDNTPKYWGEGNRIP